MVIGVPDRLDNPFFFSDVTRETQNPNEAIGNLKIQPEISFLRNSCFRFHFLTWGVHLKTHELPNCVFIVNINFPMVGGPEYPLVGVSIN